MSNHYQLLNIQPTATTEEIQAAYYRKRADLLSQGDATPSSESDGKIEAVEAQLSALEAAYTTLMDANRRAIYDRELGIGTPSYGLAVGDHQPAAIAVPQAPSAPIMQIKAQGIGKIKALPQGAALIFWVPVEKGPAN